MFYIRLIVLFAITTFVFLVATSPALASNYLVERVRYCTSPAVDNKCVRGNTPAKFEAWQRHRVNKSRQKQTYITTISQPNPAKVKNVVFISAGQQVEVAINPDGYRNVLTGQPEDYKKNCNGRTQTCRRNFRSSSLAMRLKNSGEFNMSETLFILVLDSQYNYYLTEKDEMLEAYWDFLTSKFYPGTAKQIVLAGQSRGGCLSFRLAQRFRSRSEYKEIPLILQGYDAVCRNDGSELPMPGTKHINPLNSSFKAMAVNMDAVFPRRVRKNLFISNVTGGGKVGGLPFRAFTYKPVDTKYGWWEQRWVNYGHTRMGGGFDILSETVNPGLRHIYGALERMKQDKRPISLGPVDINKDGLSDIIMREHVPARARRLTLKTKIAKGDGTFKTVVHESSNGPGVTKYPPLVGYFSKDHKTDIVFLERDRNKGLIIRTKISKGDGTYTEVDFVSGDGTGVDKYPALVGDVNRDGLTDIILRWRHAQKGLMIRTKLSNGDGTYQNKDWKSGDGSAVDKLQAFAADVNRDDKTDIIMQYQGNKGYRIRTLISQGDGTYLHKEYDTGIWVSWKDLRSHVGDLNGDKKTDLLVHHREKNGNLAIKAFLSKGDGTYDRKLFEAPVDMRGKYMLPSFVADMTGDRKTELVMRYRQSDTAQTWAAYSYDGNDGFTKTERQVPSPQEDDVHPVLLGAFNHSFRLREDPVLRRRTFPASDLNTVTVWGNASGPLQTANFRHTSEGVSVDEYPAITGPIHIHGRGGAFRQCPPRVCPRGPAKPGGVMGTVSKPALKNAVRRKADVK